MIQINKITPPSVTLYNPDGEFIGVINEYEFNDFRLQICQNNIQGYFIEYKDRRIFIDNDGNLDEWPYGLFDHFSVFAANLFKSRKEKNDTYNNKQL